MESREASQEVVGQVKASITFPLIVTIIHTREGHYLESCIDTLTSQGMLATLEPPTSTERTLHTRIFSLSPVMFTLRTPRYLKMASLGIDFLYNHIPSAETIDVCFYCLFAYPRPFKGSAMTSCVTSCICHKGVIYFNRCQLLQSNQRSSYDLFTRFYLVRLFFVIVISLCVMISQLGADLSGIPGT